MRFAEEKDTQWPAPALADVSSKPNSRKPRSPKEALDTALDVSRTAFRGETLRGLIDEWLIQAMVNRYIHERLETAQQEHNGRQP